MAAHTSPSIFLGRRLARAGVLVCLAAGGVTLVGCADTMTNTPGERMRGQTLLAEGDSEEAAILFANQVRRSPQDYKAHFFLGEARMQGGRHSEAIRSYRTALEVMDLSYSGQADDEFRFRIVDSLSTALAASDVDGDQLAAIEQRGKGDKNIKLLAGMTHAKAGRPDNAIEAFTAAMTLDRNDPQIPKQFGLYLQSLAQNDQAEYYLRRAYRLNTQDEEVAAALRRLGIIPGPAVLSATELSRPPVPLGPIPEVKWGEKPAPKAGEGDSTQSAPPAAPQNNRTLN